MKKLVVNIEKALEDSYERLLKDMLYITKNKQTAQDWAQNTCIHVILMKKSSWKDVEIEKFPSWLSIVGKRLYYTSLRKKEIKALSIDSTKIKDKEKERRVRYMAHNLKANDVVNYKGKVFEDTGDQRKRILLNSLHYLFPLERKIIQLRMNGFDNEEISLIEKTGYSTVAANYSRACTKLREIVSKKKY